MAGGEATVRLIGTTKSIEGLSRPRSEGGGEDRTFFSTIGALEPPYDQTVLLYRLEHSDALASNVAVMEANIDGHGHRVEPVIDLRAKGAREMVDEAVFARIVNEGREPPDLDDDAIDAEVDRLRRRMRVDRARLDALVANICEGSFVSLRRQWRVDLEAVGNAYGEVLRNRKGQIARLRYVPAYLCRLMPLDEGWTQTTTMEKTGPVDWRRVPYEKRFRRFVQRDELTAAYTYFREVGDPRTLSAETGRYYADEEALRRVEGPSARPATEMVHFRIHWPKSPYGVPRWVSGIPQVEGKRAAAETNYYLFDRKGVPPVVVSVSGGKLADGAVEMLGDYFDQNIVGRENWSKIALIEAVSDGKSGTAPRVEFHRLRSEINNDGLFLDYDNRCGTTIGSLFRIPRILRGDTDDFNRATAEAALQMAEDLTFSPERDEFDRWMNGWLLPEVGIYTYTFRSQTPITRSPDRLADQIKKLAEIGALTPRDARALSEDVFNTPLPPLPADQVWPDQPATFTLAGIQTGRGEQIEAQADELVGLEEKLAQRAERRAEARTAAARGAVGGDREIVITPDLMDRLIERG